MKKPWRWLGIGLMTLLVGGLAGGVWAYFAFARSAGNHLRAGETAYGRGLDCFARQDDSQAVQRFHETLLHADKALKAIETEREGHADPTPEVASKFRHKEGQAYWLKTRALRAHSFAKHRSEGKPLPPADGAEGTGAAPISKLPWLRIPAEQARQEAIVCLRQAALRMPENEELQREAIGLEVQFEPPQWSFISIFANNLLRLDPKDDRAHYLLARFEFEQPILNPNDLGLPGAILPPAKRSRDRMLKAREHLNQLAAAEPTPRWRTAFLRAQISAWLITYYRDPSHRKPEMEAEEMQALRALLFDEPASALARAAKEEKLHRLSRLDAEGLLALHRLALDMTIEDGRQASKADAGSSAGRVEDVQKGLDAVLAATTRLLGPDPQTGRLGDCLEAVVHAAAKAQPSLAKERSDVWKTHIDAIQSLAKQAIAKNAGGPADYLKLAELISHDGELAGRQGNRAGQTERRKQAVGWVDEGMKLAQARKVPADQLLALHETAARMKALNGGRREDVAAHVSALKASKNTAAQAGGFLIDGVVAEREGRLERARDALEQAARLAPGGDIARRAHTILAHLHLTLGQPDKALVSLREVEKAFARWDRLSDEERGWVFEFVRNPAQVVGLQVQSHLASAARKHAEISRTKTPKDAAALRTAIANHEQEAAKLHARLPKPSPTEQAARELWVAYFTGTERATQASQTLASLRKDYPDSLNALRLEIRLLSLPPAGDTMVAQASTAPRPDVTGKADDLIKRFLSNNAGDFAARLFWVEWLYATGRSVQAAAYLDDPGNFPGGSTDPRYQRLRAVLLRKMDGKQATDVVQADMRDPVVDAALIQAAATLEEKQRQVADALGRYENVGLFRCWNASLAAARRDYPEAARGFVSALECTRARPAARQGLQRTLTALALEQPQQARDLAAAMLQDYPGEPALLMSYAHASFLLGDIGNPADGGDKIKDMATALNAWEAAIQQEARDPAAGPLGKAQMWMQAGRSDRARPEVQRALQQNPKSDTALTLAIQLALQSKDPVALAAASKYIAVLRELHLQSPLPALFAAQLAALDGRSAEAIKTYETLIQENPKLSPAYAGLIELLEQNADVAKATTFVRQWRQQVPTDLSAAQAEVRVCARTGQIAAARAVLDQFLTLVERPNEAAGSDAARAAQQMRTRNVVILTLAHGLVQAQAWAEAETWAQRVLDGQPDDEAACLFLGDLYLARLRAAKEPSERLHCAGKARDAFTQIYKNQKGHVIAGNNLAWLLVTELNDADEAYRIMQEVRQNRYTGKPQAGELLPMELLDTCGVVYAKLDRPALAAEERDLFESARRRFPQDARVYLYLAHAYAGLRDFTKAREMLASAVTLASDKSRSALAAEKRQAILDMAKALEARMNPSALTPQTVHGGIQ